MSLPPVTIFLSNSSVDEDSPFGQVVGTVSVMGATESYSLSLVDDAGGRFSLDANNDLIVSSPLDYEAAPFHPIRVAASDLDATFEETFLIQVADVAGVSIRLAPKGLGWFHGTLEGDAVIGSAAAERIAASAGNDFVSGRGGDDALAGGLGQDALTGGHGADRFIFRSIAQSSVAAPDTIGDFDGAEGDVIDLRAIEAKSLGGASFDFIGNHGFSNHAGELRFDLATHLLQGDVDGDGSADFAIEINVADLTRGDLLL